MSQTRYIKNEIWDDEWFYDLDPVEKLVWLFLLTNNRCNIAGVYKMNMKWGARLTGLDTDIFPKILKRLEDAGKVHLHDDWLFIVNFTKHQAENPSVRAGIVRILKEVPGEAVDSLRQAVPACPTLLYLTQPNSTQPNGGEPDTPPETPTQKKAKYDEEDMKLAELLITLIQANTPEWTLKGNKDTWAEHIAKLHRIDGRTYEQIEYMIRWTQADPFWRQNILSTAKLREKFNDLIPKLKASVTKNVADREKASKPKMI